MSLLGLPDWALFLVTACILLYMYAARNRNFWKNQNVVQEDFSLVFGPTLRLLRKTIFEMDRERCKKFGNIFGVYEGGKPTLFVSDPDLVKRVLVKDFHILPNRRQIKFFDPLLDNMMNIAPVERWRKIRPAASPAFSTGKLRKMNALINDCARITSEHLIKLAEQEKDVDIKQFYGHYSLDVIARCAFGTRLDSHTDQTNEFVTRARKAFSGRITLPIIVLVVFPEIFKALRLRAFNTDTFLYFKNLSLNIIKNRVGKEKRHEDFLQLMVDAQGSGITAATETPSGTENGLYNLDSELKTDEAVAAKSLTEDEALAQCVLFFLAGQDTTSSAVSFATYLLALNPDAQARLRKEADECFEAHGNEPSLDVVSKLKYLDAVVSETLRMFPPAVRIERSAVEDYVLGDTGIKVPKGCVVAIPVHAMHYDENNFPHPHTFDPERFNESNLSSIRPYTYLPFGAGPRNCIGMRFALQAVKLSLLHSIRSVEFVPTKNTKVPLEFYKGFGILNAKDITVGVRMRTK